jgi:DegV family protein with EDD domain
MWENHVKEFNLEVIHIPIALDGVDLETSLPLNKLDEFYASLKKGIVSKTALINEFTFEETFEKYLAKGEDVLFIHFSGSLTGSYKVLPNVRDKLLAKYPERKLLFVDTLGVTMQSGVMVYTAAKMYKSGKSFEEIVLFLEDLKQHIACYFGMDDLFYLKRGGRISAMAAIGGTMLGIKPICKCDAEGKIVKYSTTKGWRGIISKLVSLMQETGDGVADFPIIVAHASNETDAKTLQEEVYKIVGRDANVWIIPIGAIIGTHCGPGTVGLVFRAKHR